MSMNTIIMTENADVAVDMITSIIMTMKSMNITMMTNADADMTMITKNTNTIMTTNMNIITMMNVDADMTMIMKNMNTIMTTNMNIIMMRMVYAAVDHHHHHADEVFTSWGKETPRKYSKEELEHILKTLNESEDLGMVLRAKGMLPCTDGTWMHFDLVPGEYEIRTGAADYTGRLCVIGSKLKEEKLEELFLLK